MEEVNDNRFVQFGQLKGCVEFESNGEEVYLWGTRSKQVVNSHKNDNHFKRTVIMWYCNGYEFHDF